MIAIATGSALAGGVLIGLTMFDIVATVLHPQAQRAYLSVMYA